MAKWTIYDRNGKALHESKTEFNGDGKIVYQDTLEYSGKWMGERFLTVSIKSAYPIDFQIGDYIEYRGEKFTINYDPTVIKKARRGTYGEGFTYDSIKFNSPSNELTQMRFHDWVLSDNKLHYTSLPTFSFYAKDVDDLVDRLQACSDRWCKDNGYPKEDYWMFYTLRNNTVTGTADPRQTQTTYQRTLSRAKDVLESCGIAETSDTGKAYLKDVQSKWENMYGTGDNYTDSRDDERYDRNISVSNQSVWDGMAMIKQQFGLNFIVRGRNIYIGAAGIPTNHLFKYGKGNGLYEVDRTADQDQAVVTKLHAYGSGDNLPTRYYADLNTTPYLDITGDYHPGSTEKGLSVMLEDSKFNGMFTSILSNPTSNIKHCKVTCSIDGLEFVGYVELVNTSGLASSTRLVYAVGDSESPTATADVVKAIKDKIDAGNKRVIFLSGANADGFDVAHITVATKNLPDNMAVNFLMLPGFPNNSLADICRAEYDKTNDVTNYYITNPSTKTEVLFHTESGNHVIKFSTDKYDPYIVSPNAETLGIKDFDISCTEDNDDNGLEKVYPTIEEITDADAGIGSTGKRLDEVVKADRIDDNGVYPKNKTDEEKIPGFHIWLPDLGFDLKQAAEDAGGGDVQISMKDGFCGARTFSCPQVSQEKDGTWKLSCKRVYDSNLDLYFPYSYAKSVSGVDESMTNAYQVCKGDHYVLTGIAVSDVNYVWAASVKLLRKAIHWLCKNDYTRYVYQPKIDEIYMAREAVVAEKLGNTSLHDALMEGDILLFSDDDLKIDGKVYIDQLNIKENGNNGIPTYEVTLRNEVQVGSLQRLQNQVDSIANDVKKGNVGGGLTSPTQVAALIEAYGEQWFVSKTKDDTVSGFLTFLKGFVSKAKATFEDAVEVLKNLTVGGSASVGGDASIGGNSTTGGNASVGGSLIADDVHSRRYSDALDQSSGMGYHIWVNGNTSNAIFDNLSVRGKWTASVLEVMKLQYSAGNITIDGAGGEIFAVEPFGKDGESLIPTDNLITTASTGNLLSDEGKVLKEDKKEVPYSDSDVYFYRCYFKATDGEKNILNMWHVGDQARCQTFNLSDGTHLNAQNKTYFRVVINKSDVTVLVDGTPCFYIDLSNVQNGTLTGDDGKEYNYRGLLHSKADDGTVTWLTNDAPEKGDQVAHVGNVYDEERQGAVQLVAVGAEKGLFIYDGINETLENLNDFLRVKWSPKNSLLNTTFLTYTNGYHTNNPYIYCGDWSKGTTAHPNEVWQHNGGSWICNTTTTSEPADGNDAWSSFAQKGEKGEKGDKGDSVKKTGEKIEYAISNSGTSVPTTGWQTTIPSTTTDKPYLWTRSTITLSSGDPVVSYSVSRQGTDGKNGKPLKVSSVTRYHKGDKPTSDSGYELNSFPEVSQGDVVWNITITTYTNPDTNEVVGSSTAYGCSRIGTDGTKGASVHIAYATSADGKTGFSTVWFANATYLGVCVSADTDDPMDYTQYKWNKIKGENGTDGLSVLTFTTNIAMPQHQAEQFANQHEINTYPVNEDTSNAKEGDSVMLRFTNVNKHRFAWLVGIIRGVASTSSLKVEATGFLDSGDDGTSVTITSNSVSYQLSDSATTIPTGTWSEDILEATDEKPYLWTKTVVNYSDGTPTTSYSVSYKGADGAPSETYYINPSALIVTERLNTANDNTDKEKKYTDKDFVYDIPSTFSIHHSVGDSDSIIKIADNGWGCSEGASLLPSGWNLNLQNSFVEGKGYDLTSILTKSGLMEDSSVLKIVLVAKVSDSVSLNIEIYINRLGTTQMETYGDTTTIVRDKVLADVKEGYVDVDTYNNYTKATSEQFGNYYTKTQMDGQTGDIKKSISSVEQTADNISLMVTSQRSGRNLWINGDFEMNPDLAPKYSYNLGDEGGSQGINSVALPAGFNKQVVFKCSKAFQGIYYNGTQPNLDLTKGTTYCLSFFARVNMEVTGKIYFGMSGLTTTTEDITATWKRYCIYLTPDKDYAAKGVSIVFYPYTAITDADGNASYICLTGIQFEVGSKSTGAPTVWSKSTDDMKQATGIDIQNGLINAVAGMFNFVGKDKKPYIRVEQDSDGYPHVIFYNPNKTDSAGNLLPAYDLGFTGMLPIIGTGKVASWLHVRYQKSVVPGSTTNARDFYREMIARGYMEACRYNGGYYLNPQFGKVWLPAEAEKYDQLYYDTDSWDRDFLPTGELLADGWHLYQSGYKSGGVYDGVTAGNQNKGHYYEYTYGMFYTKSGKRYTTEHTVSVRYTDSRLVAEGYEYGMYFDGDSTNIVYYGTTGNTTVFPSEPTE